MAMYDSAEKLREEFKELFKDGLNFRQLWWVANMCKAVRLYCRSNVAFDNFMNSVFRGMAEFKQVHKQDAQGNGYIGLEIKVIRSDGTFSAEVMRYSSGDSIEVM